MRGHWIDLIQVGCEYIFGEVGLSEAGDEMNGSGLECL